MKVFPEATNCGKLLPAEEQGLVAEAKCIDVESAEAAEKPKPAAFCLSVEAYVATGRNAFLGGGAQVQWKVGGRGGVGVQEVQPATGGDGRSGVHLPGSARRGDHHGRA